MLSSIFQGNWMHRLVVAGVLGMCFLLFFYAYYKPDIKFPSFSLSERGNYSCPVVVCEKPVQTPQMIPNCSLEHHVTPPHTQINDTRGNDIKEIQPTTPAQTEDKIIFLIWIWPFGYRHSLDCKVFNITGCHLTDDRSLYSKAHGVIFHHRDIQGNLGNLPQEPRPFFQKWVWFNMESPANSAQRQGLNNLFNLTCNYKLDSNIPVPYGHLELQTSGETFKLPPKDKLVCWVVSNWNSGYKRVQYFNELKKYININTYGSAFGKRVSNEDYTNIVTSCKFYLSFENSIYKDYITEKLYSPLAKGTVPIALGPSRQNYETHVPSDSFIHVNDFPSAKELADRIMYLDKNETEYMRYFEWKKRFKVSSAGFGGEHACKSCAYIQRNRGYQAFTDLNKWYWG